MLFGDRDDRFFETGWDCAEGLGVVKNVCENRGQLVCTELMGMDGWRNRVWSRGFSGFLGFEKFADFPLGYHQWGKGGEARRIAGWLGGLKWKAGGWGSRLRLRGVKSVE